MSALTQKSDGLVVTAHGGDGAVLLAFDLDQAKIDNLAGFSIKCKAPNTGPYASNEYFLKNLLDFKTKLTNEQSLANRQLVGSDQAPFQTFHWVAFPGAGPGIYEYTVYASYFDGKGNLKQGASVALDVDLSYQTFNELELGFTRGYVSSQAYVDRFGNKPLRPAQKSIDFDTTPYQDQYLWLGAHARKIIFDFLNECLQDPAIYLDVFAYDFDEPDVIRALAKLGSHVRLFQDDASLHTGPNAMEPKTVADLENAGADVKTGHFNRFAHDKVMIQKKDGNAKKVLTGSANFSIRGLYVQANSILLFNSPAIAELYEEAFDQAFTNESKFKTSQIASKWFPVKEKGLPQTSISFAPHVTPFSLTQVSDAIEQAKSSVFFAVMQMAGSGSVMVDLEALGGRADVFSLGTIEAQADLKLFKPGIDANSAVTSFQYLQTNVPEPFKTEWRGGAGQVIHHKFLVCDFNDASPVVFCGSSNLAAGGETSNGDNLIALNDPKIATYYAVEAIRLFDHFRFRSLHEQSGTADPMMLKSDSSWTEPFYDPKDIKFRERQILCEGARKLAPA